MRRFRVFALVAAMSCGGSQKPSSPPPPLADTKTEAPEAKPEPSTTSPAEPKPAEPAEPPAGPLAVTVPAAKITVKLVSAGKGKKLPLKLSAKAGDKQTIELALDFAGKSVAPAEFGGTQEDVAPTVVMNGDAEVKAVDKDGAAQFEMTVSGFDVRDAPGQKVPSDKMKEVLTKLKDLKIGGTIAANGVPGEIKMSLDKADRIAAGALELIRVESLPAWPALPTEPIGVGAKWQAISTVRIADKLDTTQTTDYELVKHDGKTWTIKGTTKVSGADQDVEQAKLTKIGGAGSVEVALVDGALYPSLKSEVTTSFTATVNAPADAPSGTPKSVSVTTDLKQGAKVTPKP